MIGASPIARCKPTQYLFIEVSFQPPWSDQWIGGPLATLMFGLEKALGLSFLTSPRRADSPVKLYFSGPKRLSHTIRGKADLACK
jgi:hypothetical protein